MKRKIKIATRKSPMALWQAHFVAEQLKNQNPNLEIEFLGLVTQGDQNLQIPLTAVGGKSLFVKELQQALLSREADLAVHCVKDMSVQPCPGLILAAVCKREDPRDAFISVRYAHFNELPKAAVIGSSSPRRQSQLLAQCSDIRIKTLRGNVNTRLEKLKQQEYDAIILSAAGLKRLNFENSIKHYFSPEEMLPCIGQGALGLECREDDQVVISLIKKLNHAASEICVSAERSVNRFLGGDCYTPIAAHAYFIEDNFIKLSALVGSLDGKTILRSEIKGAAVDAEKLGINAAQDLLNQGAALLLKSQQ